MFGEATSSEDDMTVLSGKAGMIGRAAFTGKEDSTKFQISLSPDLLRSTHFPIMSFKASSFPICATSTLL